MNAAKILGAAAIVAMAAMPALADDMMSTMSMMKGGEVIAVMPDGHMGTMMADTKASGMMMQMAKPIDHCMMMMMGADGKAYMIDTSSADAMKECEGMAK